MDIYNIYNFLVTHFDEKLIIIVMMFWYISTYRRDQKDHDTRVNQIFDVLKTQSNAIEEQGKVIYKHVNVDEPEQYRRIDEKLTNIKVTLAKNYIGRAHLEKGEWDIVMSRLNETADIAFNVAFKKACESCSGECTYKRELGVIAQERRIESLNVWEEAAVSPEIIEAIKHVDKSNYKLVQDVYIPDIISICVKKEYNVLPIELKLELIKGKIDAVITKVKADWKEELLKYINAGVS